jgi:hypothetical protein
MQAQASRRRPTAVVVIAILNLIFGCLGLLFAATFVLFTSTGLGEVFVQINQTNPGRIKGMSAPEIHEAIAQKVPHYTAITNLGATWDTLASAALVLSGWALLKMRSWGRTLAIVYGFVQIGAKIVSTVYSFVFVQPAMAELMQQALDQAPLGFQRAVIEWTLGIMSAAGIAAAVVAPMYPMLVLVAMFLPSVRKAFAPQPKPSVPTESQEV